MIEGLYIHIPFCKRICSYCDFNKRVSNNDLMIKYRNALISEIEDNINNYKDLKTIYIGGGTPSFYPYLKDILETLRKYINLSNIIEFTVESTLETVNNIMPFIKEYNINRISIGIESFNKKTLEYINRPYIKNKEIFNIINILRNNGIDNINIDMISGLPYETKHSLKKGLYFLNRLNVDHISYYDLIVEDKTKLSFDLKNKQVSLLSQDDLYEFSKIINKFLRKKKYIRYEFSNYSKISKESIHNLSYWNLKDYLGLGLNSHSLIDGKRYYNTSDIKTYINNPTKTKEYEETDLKKEYFILGLRKIKGVSLKEYSNIYNIGPLKEYPFINKYLELGLLKINNDMLSFTEKGIDLSNVVLREFV